MTDRITRKINKMFDKYNTDCLIGIIKTKYDKERKAIIVNTYYSGINVINIIVSSGVNLTCIYNDLLYVRDLQDIAFNEIFNK